jgi:predicted nucleic acid-binding protein
MTPEAAFGVLRQLLADPRHEFIPDDLSCTDRVVRTELMPGANQITDRYPIALARHQGASLAILDQPLAKSFAGEPSLVELVH